MKKQLIGVNIIKTNSFIKKQKHTINFKKTKKKKTLVSSYGYYWKN